MQQIWHSSLRTCSKALLESILGINVLLIVMKGMNPENSRMIMSRQVSETKYEKGSN